MRDTPLLLSFNRGIMAKQALARLDLKRTALSAEIMNNYMPRTFGSMSLRAGLGYLGSSLGDAQAVAVPFVFATDDTAIVELTNTAMRVWLDDAVITRGSVSSAVTNGSFATDVTGWTDSDEAGATSAWLTGGYLSLTGTGVNSAIRDQQVTVAAGDQNDEHALAIEVTRGLLYLSVGSSAGGTQYINKMALRPGRHSIAFTPTGNIHIRLSALTESPTLVASIAVEAAGAMTLTTPWETADLSNVRHEQSGDVIFCCDGTHQQRRIERQATRSWSCVEYLTTDGPFRSENASEITLTASSLSGSGTLTASQDLFRSGHVGALFRLASTGQTVAQTITGEDQWSDPIRVNGINNARVFSVIISGVAAADTSIITLQRSIGAPGDWQTVTTYAADASLSYDDGLDNQIIYYRIGVKVGEYDVVTGDTFDVQLTYASGVIEGVGRVTGYTSATVVNIDVLTDFGATTATSSWWEGRWSDYRGWPSGVAIHDGRLWWAGHDRINGSVSDAYNSFGDIVEGDAGPIDRNVGSGPVDRINWIMSLTQLLFGTQGSELTARASSLDEPLTPTAFSLRAISTNGSASVQAVKIDTSGIFVQRNGFRVMEASIGEAMYSYVTNDLTSVVPDIGAPGIVKIVVQRQPDTRVHCIRSDGTIAVMVFDKAEQVTCWIELETDGIVEDAVVLPGTGEDAVYYFVKRTINGGTKRYMEKFALESECIGGTLNKQADSFVTFTNGTASATITGLSHLVAEDVVVWADGKCLADADGNIETFTVNGSGEITVTNGGAAYLATTGIVGLPYTAQFKSSKFSLSNRFESVSLTNPKQITHVGLLLSNTHAKGVKYGQDFDHLDDMPLHEGYGLVDADSIWEEYEDDSVEVNGTWDRDARLCLQSAAPRPCTVVACLVDISGHAK